jgi:hypothetical protein
VRIRLSEVLRLLLVLVLTLNATGSAAAGVMYMAPGNAGQSRHHGHEGISGMTHDSDQAGQPGDDCCNETTQNCDCSCALHQPAALRVIGPTRDDAPASAPVAPAISRQPSDSFTTPFRPPA